MSDDINLYVVGEVVRASVTLTTVSSEALADPTDLILKIVHPNKSVDTYEYGVDAGLIRDSIGEYHFDFEVTEPGEWGYYFKSTGNAAGAGNRVLYVNRSVVP